MDITILEAGSSDGIKGEGKSQLVQTLSLSVCCSQLDKQPLPQVPTSLLFCLIMWVKINLSSCVCHSDWTSIWYRKENLYQTRKSLLWLNMTMKFLSIWNCFLRGIWKSLGLWDREALEFCNTRLMVILVDAEKTGMSIELWHSVLLRKDLPDCIHEISDGSKDFIGNWTGVIHVTFWQKIYKTCTLFRKVVTKLKLRRYSFWRD
jgi:hypothetical protein